MVSEKREAARTYTGESGYQPTVTYWADQKMVLYEEFRDGNVPAGEGVLRVLRRAVEALPKRRRLWILCRAAQAVHHARKRIVRVRWHLGELVGLMAGVRRMLLRLSWQVRRAMQTQASPVPTCGRPPGQPDRSPRTQARGDGAPRGRPPQCDRDTELPAGGPQRLRTANARPPPLAEQARQPLKRPRHSAPPILSDDYGSTAWCALRPGRKP